MTLVPTTGHNGDEMLHNEKCSPEIQQTAQKIVHARSSGNAIPTSAIITPSDVNSAMQIQSLVQEASGAPVRGWKVAIGPESRAIAAPLVDILASPAELRLFPNFLIEVEVAVVLKKDLPKREVPYKRSEVIGALDHVFLGIEVIGGRYEEPKSVPFLSFLADHLGNRAFVVGDVLPVATLDQLAGLTCNVTFDGRAFYSANAAHPAQDPLAPLLAYANEPNDFVGGLRAGQIVTTGSICGVLPINQPGLVKAELGALGQVVLRFTGSEELYGFLVR